MTAIVYNATAWVDGPGGNTPISSAHLNNMETGIVAAVNAINSMQQNTTNLGSYPSLQAAINAVSAAGGGAVMLPPGPTAVSAKVSMLSNVVVSGPPSEYSVTTGHQTSYLVFDTSTTNPCIEFATSVDQAALHNVTIQAPATRIGVNIADTSQRGGNRLRNIYIYGGSVGIYVGQKETRLEDILVMNAASDGVQINGQDCQWDGGIIGYNGGNGIVLGSTSGPIRATTIDTFYNTLAGIVIDGDGHRINGLIANNNKRQGVYFRSATTVTISAIMANDNGLEYNGTTNLIRYSDVLFGHPTAGNAGCEIIGGTIRNTSSSPTKYAVESTESTPSIPTLIGVYLSGTYSLGNSAFNIMGSLANFNVLGCTNIPDFRRPQAGVPLIFAPNGTVDQVQHYNATTTAVASGIRSGGAPYLAVVSVNASASSGAPSLDTRTANVWNITLDQNVTACTATNLQAGQQLTIRFIQDATGGRTYVWPSSCRFAGNIAPIGIDSASHVESVTFLSDGTNLNEIGRAVDTQTVASIASTVTAGGTTTLTAASAPIQIFTGSSAQTCALPTTSVPAGFTTTIINQSSQFITVNSSGGNLVTYVAPSSVATVASNVATPTTAAHWTITVFPGTVSNALGAAVVRDVVGMVAFTNSTQSQTTTATSGGTKTLAYGTDVNRTQIFTGSSNHTLVLPSTGMGIGVEFLVVNLSTGTITVNASGGATLLTVGPGQIIRVMTTASAPTTASGWSVIGFGGRIPGGLATRTSEFSLSNSTTETDVLSATLPTGDLIVGATYRVVVSADVNLLASNNLTVAAYVGGVKLSAAFTWNGATTNTGWWNEFLITVRSIGSSGTVMCNSAGFGSGSGSSVVTSTDTVNTTQTSPILKVTAQFSAASASNNVKIENAIIERVI